MRMETKRLILRLHADVDFDDYFAYIMDPALQRMLGLRNVTDRESAYQTFQWLRENTEFWAVILRESGRVIGHICLHPAQAGYEVTFAISKDFRRQGLMEEALRALIGVLFNRPDVHELVCCYTDFNAASRALQEKLGFRVVREEPVEDFILYTGVLRREDRTMDTILLKTPSMADQEAVWALRQELLDENGTFDGCSRLECCDTYENWLAHLAQLSSAQTCPAGKVPSTVFLGIRERDGLPVGIIDLRHHIDHPVLSLWGGHIGYSVRPTERRKGYATQMLRAVLGQARKLGLARVMVTCNDGNLASEKTILSCGGMYEKTVQVEDTPIKRFWIEL